jgi:hypothetical protein
MGLDSGVQGVEGSRERFKTKNPTLEPLNPRILGPLFIFRLFQNSRDLRSAGF